MAEESIQLLMAHKVDLVMEGKTEEEGPTIKMNISAILREIIIHISKIEQLLDMKEAGSSVSPAGIYTTSASEAMPPPPII